MLNIINNIQLLKPFIEDCYSEVHVREYAKLVNLSPPTASKILKELENQKILKMRLERKYLLFRSNRESELLKDISAIFWKHNLKELIDYLDANLSPSSIILFGSLSKLEAKKDSDIDMAVITKIKKSLNMGKFNSKYKREVQLFIFKSLNEISKELKNNILKGVILKRELT